MKTLGSGAGREAVKMETTVIGIDTRPEKMQLLKCYILQLKLVCISDAFTCHNSNRLF